MAFVSDPALFPIAAKVEKGLRLDAADGLTLFNSPDLLGIGDLANLVRVRKNQNKTYFICNVHINYTNICKNNCAFCAFSKKREDSGAYVMDLIDVLDHAAREALPGLREFHLVGGLNPDLPFDYYLNMLRVLKHRFPYVHLQAFTAVEIGHLAEISGLSLRDTLLALRKAGLGSLPGGGAEVFSPRIRKKLCPEKMSPEKWLQIMRQAHQLGIASNATMLYGHLESKAERVQHLLQLRRLQDETGGFMSFIPLPFHPKNTQLSNLQRTSGADDLKTLAVSRLMLDNFPHIKAFWIMLGVKLAQISLKFGVDDIDGTVREEKITHAAGASTAQGLSRNQLKQLILDAGQLPVERDTLYNPIRRAARPELPASRAKALHHTKERIYA